MSGLWMPQAGTGPLDGGLGRLLFNASDDAQFIGLEFGFDEIVVCL